MEVPEFIQKYNTEIRSICEQYNVDRLYVFGSVLTDNFDPNSSDIDLIVELKLMPPLEKGQALLDLWDEFEILFGRKVDLLTDQPIKNRILRAKVQKTKQLIYDGRGKEVFV